MTSSGAITKRDVRPASPPAIAVTAGGVFLRSAAVSRVMEMGSTSEQRLNFTSHDYGFITSIVFNSFQTLTSISFMNWFSAIVREFLTISHGMNWSYVQHLQCSVGVIAVGGVDF